MYLEVLKEYDYKKNIHVYVVTEIVDKLDKNSFSFYPKDIISYHYMNHKFIVTYTREVTDNYANKHIRLSRLPSINYEIKIQNKNSRRLGSDGGFCCSARYPIVAIRIGVDIGYIKYRVCTSRGWLPYVTGNDWIDFYNGYAGDDIHAIHGIEIQYYNNDGVTYRIAFSIQRKDGKYSVGHSASSLLYCGYNESPITGISLCLHRAK